MALAGLAFGLGSAPHLPPTPIDGTAAGLLIALAIVGLLASSPRDSSVGLAWAGLVLLVAVAAGLVIGDARVAAIDRAAYTAEPGARVAVRGFVAGVPRPLEGHLLVPVETADGLLAVEAPEPDSELQVGGEIRAQGSVRVPEPWQRGRLMIAGIARIVAARSIEATSRRRGGLGGTVDGVRDRAEAALERGVPAREAALARGFVLGQDDRIDAATVDDFRRSGLAHLLAVSGQNVLLLALLAFPVLAILGLPLRARLAVVIGLILLYVPITGAGPSIQRAAVMGIAGIAALLAGRPSHRWYAVLLAAALTLALNPRAAGDIGWQLSFAAVVGILLWARPIATLVVRRRDGASNLRRGLADGIGVTVAATIATAPISALHFETLSLASLPANLLALPAVAPVMWLGMLSAALGQLAWVPLEPLNWLCSLLVAYIAQVAHWLAAPGWASLPVTAPSPAAIAFIGAAMLTGGALAIRALGRRQQLGGRRRPRLLAHLVVPLGLVAAALLVPVGPSSRAPAVPPPRGLTLTFLDVGQGEAILLDPEPGDPVLVDAGPAGSDLPAKLADRAVERLAAVVVTHTASDHVGGLSAVLERISADAVVHADADRALRALAGGAGAPTREVSTGATLRSGALTLDVLWPPQADRAGADGDPNHRSIVLLARWRGFDALLTGDGEAEAIPLDPGPLDVLKLAHHGSEDAGLPELIERTDPAVAVISVGAENPFGHPHPSTLGALADENVPVLRTDRDGDVEIRVSARGFAVTG